MAREHLVVEPGQGRVVKADVKFVVDNATGTGWVTDVLLQAGRAATLWCGHPSELPWTEEG